MNTSTNVYVYSLPRHEYKIVKMVPFSSFFVNLDKNGQHYMQIFQGKQMENPVWEWMREYKGHVYAKYDNDIYNITDLYGRHISAIRIPRL
jgi:hypothetical protein